MADTKMTWLLEEKRTWAEWAALGVLKVGPVPCHIAIIMDGNRRYARKEHKETLQGHTQGFHKLTEVLSWCRDLGINQVTAYAFSIENFKRSKQEVDELMELAADKFEKLLEETEKLLVHGVCIRVIGKLSLLPPRIRKLASEAVLVTKDNKKCFLNLAIAYTSREEIKDALDKLSYGVKEKFILNSDITEDLLEKCFYTSGSSEPDLLVRTSGEVRLSDFLLWQSGYSCLFFTTVLWPEFTIWHLFGAIFYYQRHYHTLSEAKRESIALRQCATEENDIQCCHDKLGDTVLQDHIAHYAAARLERTENFLKEINMKEEEYLKVCSNIVLD